jgi:hypothetical protein
MVLEGMIFAHILVEWIRVVLYPGAGVGGAFHMVRRDAEGGLLGQNGLFTAEIFVALAVRLTEYLYLEAFNLSCSIALPTHQYQFAGDDKVGGFTVDDPAGYVRGGIGLRYDLALGDR